MPLLTAPAVRPPEPTAATTGARRRPAGAAPSLFGYRELAAWQESVELCVACHRLTRRLANGEAEGLRRSIGEAASVVAVGVAEGHARLLRTDVVQHLAVARGALHRLETLLEIAHRLGYLDAADRAALDQRCAGVGRQLARLIRSVYGIGADATPIVGRRSRPGVTLGSPNPLPPPVL